MEIYTHRSQSFRETQTRVVNINENFDYSEFDCKICIETVRQPELCDHCEAQFCNGCIGAWLKKGKKTCPNCRYIYKPHISIRYNSKLKEALFQCQYHQNGCREILRGDKIRDHHDLCKYKMKIAPKIRCESCSQVIYENDLEFHNYNECEARMKVCKFCKQKYHYSKQYDHENNPECIKIQNLILKMKSQVHTEYAHLQKINLICLGNVSVGKSSLITNYIQGNFTPSVKTTLSIEMVQREVPLRNGEVMSVVFWDTAGDEKYKSVTQSYLRKKDGVMLLYDITDYQTFANLDYWLNLVENNAPHNIVKMLIGTNLDKEDHRQVSKQSAFQFARDNDIALVEEVSSITGKNIVRAIENFVQVVYERKMDDGDLYNTNKNESGMKLGRKRPDRECSINQYKCKC